MTETKNWQNLGGVSDLLAQLPPRQIPQISAQDTVNEIIEAFAGSSHSRVLYVLDSDGRLEGVIALGDLVRHVLFHYHDSGTNGHQLISLAVSEVAADFMLVDPLSASAGEELETVLERMVQHNLKEIPILDPDGRVIADLTIVDMLKQYQEMRARD